MVGTSPYTQVSKHTCIASDLERHNVRISCVVAAFLQVHGKNECMFLHAFISLESNAVSKRFNFNSGRADAYARKTAFEPILRQSGRSLRIRASREKIALELSLACMTFIERLMD